METRRNHRGYEEHFMTGRHLRLDGLREEVHNAAIRNRYIFKENIPLSSRPEFRVDKLKHDTGPTGLSGILRDGGFKNPWGGLFLWWTLYVGEEEMKTAESRLRETTFPDRTGKQKKRQEHFLQQFATSPAFLGSSRLGSFRFIFSVQQVLKAYSKQFCGGAEPVMRVMETVLYKQEVMYVVLIHSPANSEQFCQQYPLLTDDPESVCSYIDGEDGKDGYFVWRPEAMCGTHSVELVLDDDEKKMGASRTKNDEYYLWDNVALALHVNDQVLLFDRGQLKKRLAYCKKDKIIFTDEANFVSFEDAQQIARKEFDDPGYKLEKAFEHREAVN